MFAIRQEKEELNYQRAQDPANRPEGCKPNEVAFKLGPGQGKSVVALLIACYYVISFRASVAVIVPYRALQKQYKDLLRELCPELDPSAIEIIVTKYLSPQEQLKDVVLVDEADYVVENQTFIWRHEPKKGTP